MGKDQTLEKYFKDWHQFCSDCVDEEIIFIKQNKIKVKIGTFYLADVIGRKILDMLSFIATNIGEHRNQRLFNGECFVSIHDLNQSLSVGVRYYYKLESHIKFILLDKKLI